MTTIDLPNFTGDKNSKVLILVFMVIIIHIAYLLGTVSIVLSISISSITFVRGLW